MPNIEHSVLAGADLHEPLGISSETVGKRYISDGAGSGSWVTIPTGWGIYAHSGAEQTFGTSSSKVLINGTGGTTTEDYLPYAIRDTGSLWSTVDNEITPIKLGDMYTARLVVPITSRATAQYVTLDLDIGGVNGTLTQSIFSSRLDCNKSAPFTLAYNFNFFTLDTFIANGGQLFLHVDAGSIGVTNPTLLISRIHSEPF